MRALRAAVVVLLLGGCATLNGEVAMPRADDMPELALAPSAGTSGGLFVPGAMRAITADERACRVGDVVTVMLKEATQASNSNKTALSKQGQIGMEVGQLLGSAIDLPTELRLKRQANGAGTSAQNNSLDGSITVVVQKVLPNGLLQVRGEKHLLLNQNVETVRLSGYVRTSDIDDGNRVSSQRVANARIGYSGRGAIASTSRIGWLARFFNHPLAPL